MEILGRINRKFFTVNNNKDDSLIGMGQINILKEIINHERITQDELAGVLNLDKTTIAKAVKRLEKHDLIMRNRSTTDLRKKELVATKKALLVKEHMIKHLEDKSKILFEGVSEEEIDIFKKVLEKIEQNIERRRKMINGKKQLAMKILKLIEKNDGVTSLQLAELLEKDVKEINEIVEKLTIKELVEENAGRLNISQKAKEFKKKRGAENKEHGKLFKFILKNNGLSKEELIQKSGKNAPEIDTLLKHFISKGVVEMRDGKLYVNKKILKQNHKR